MDLAIQKALEGGYKVKDGILSNVLLDKDFWQALGKSLGWPSIKEGGRGESGKGESWGYVYPWNYQMHRFIDHLISGKDIDSFFQELLANKK